MTGGEGVGIWDFFKKIKPNENIKIQKKNEQS